MTEAKATGEALVPYANGYTSFDFYIDGGLTFDGTNMEKKYQIRIDIDSEHTVNESNEQDNRGWSDTWVTDYYKGQILQQQKSDVPRDVAFLLL